MITIEDLPDLVKFDKVSRQFTLIGDLPDGTEVVKSVKIILIDP